MKEEIWYIPKINLLVVNKGIGYKVDVYFYTQYGGYIESFLRSELVYIGEL